MKNKKLISSILCIFVIAFMLVFVGCDANNSESKNENVAYEFTGFEIPETATGEVGGYYNFEKPVVIVEETVVDIAITVKCGEKNIPHNNQKVYLDAIGDFIITYTASYDGQTENKITTVKVSDTAAPVYKNELYETVRYGQTVVISDYIYALDFSGIKTVEYIVTKEDGTELPSGSFDSTTKELCITDETISKVKVNINASDIYDNSNISEDFVIPIFPVPTYGSFDLNAIDMRQVSTSSNAGGVEKVISQDEIYIETYRKSGATTGYLEIAFAITEAQKAELVHFDWFTIKFSVESYTDVTDASSAEQVRTTGTKVTTGSVSLRPNTQDDYQADLAIDGSVQECTWSRSQYAERFNEIINGNEDGTFRLKFYSSSSVYIIVRIYDIEFGYDDIVNDGTAIDLTSKFNVTANELDATFSSIEGDSVEITDKTAWIPKENGILTITINKGGFKPMQISVAVQVVDSVVDDSSENDNNFEWDW